MKIYDTENMLAMLGTAPFTKGQRLTEDTAALLNGLPTLLATLAGYQDDGLGEPTEFVKALPPVEVVAPPVTDESRHTQGDAESARLINAFAIDTKTGVKTKIAL